MTSPFPKHLQAVQKLDFEQRSRASKLEDSVNDDPYATAAEIIYLRDRNAQFERLLILATELCAAVDNEAEDIGGSRRSTDILQDIGPLTDKLQKDAGSHPAELVKRRTASRKITKRGARA